jgi:hypothetical protein
MNSLPQNFLVVNHEGVHRCYISVEPVTDFQHLVAKFATHRFVLVRKLAKHPNGFIHLAVSSRDNQPILILEATEGTLGLQTYYHLVKHRDHSWISPRFLQGRDEQATFELRCEFDFAEWTAAGLRMFFTLNYPERICQAWVTWKNQNYRVPFGNVFETGAICMENDSFFKGSALEGVDKMMAHLGSSQWNADAFDFNWVPKISKLVRFDQESLKMLNPIEPELITELGVMAHPTIAEITKLIYG